MRSHFVQYKFKLFPFHSTAHAEWGLFLQWKTLFWMRKTVIDWCCNISLKRWLHFLKRLCSQTTKWFYQKWFFFRWTWFSPLYNSYPKKNIPTSLCHIFLVVWHYPGIFIFKVHTYWKFGIISSSYYILLYLFIKWKLLVLWWCRIRCEMKHIYIEKITSNIFLKIK